VRRAREGKREARPRGRIWTEDQVKAGVNIRRALADAEM
jgi:hypothetical protein